jgi:hypothetical protein
LQEQKPYYIVAVPEGPVMERLRELQALLSRRFAMYIEPFPSLHITVGVFARDADEKHALDVLDELSSRCRRFRVRVAGKQCFSEPFLSVGVAVQSDTLSYLAGCLEGRLWQEGLSPRSFARWDFHISLVSPHFARRQWSLQEFQLACRMLENINPAGFCTLDRLELWEPDFPPLSVLGGFPFR